MISLVFQEQIQFMEASDRGKSENVLNNSYQIFDLFVICTAAIILLLSLIWLLANSILKKTEIRQIYRRFVSSIFFLVNFGRVK